MIWNSSNLLTSWSGWRRTLDKRKLFKVIVLAVMATGAVRVFPNVLADDGIPDIALLEMLGEVGDIEELGIDVDHMIEERLEAVASDEQMESDE